MNEQQDIDGAPLKLPADLGIEDIASLSEMLATRLRSDALVTLDASGVTRVHTAALQLLCMFCLGRKKAGRPTQWRSPSAALRQAVTTTALNPLLQLADN